MKQHNEIGCRKCGKGGRWAIFTDEEGHFISKCGECGHVSEFEIVDKPDKPDTHLTVDMRLLT